MRSRERKAEVAALGVESTVVARRVRSRERKAEVAALGVAAYV